MVLIGHSDAPVGNGYMDTDWVWTLNNGSRTNYLLLYCALVVVVVRSINTY